MKPNTPTINSSNMAVSLPPPNTSWTSPIKAPSPVPSFRISALPTRNTQSSHRGTAGEPRDDLHRGQAAESRDVEDGAAR